MSRSRSLHPIASALLALAPFCSSACQGPAATRVGENLSLSRQALSIADGGSDSGPVSDAAKPALYDGGTGGAARDHDGDGVEDALDPDDDNDGYPDSFESACQSDPLDAASIPPDADGDFICDAIDDNDPIVNRAPVLLAPESMATREGEWAPLFLALDPDGDALTVQVKSAPAFLTTELPGMVSYAAAAMVVPGYGDAGNYLLEFAISDGTYSLDVRVNLSVTDVPFNRAPVIDSQPSSEAHEGQLYSYQLQAHDDDGDALSYRLTAAPAGMQLDPSTGLITWTPTHEQAGYQSAHVEVSDGKTQVAQFFDVNVQGIPEPTLESFDGIYPRVYPTALTIKASLPDGAVHAYLTTDNVEPTPSASCAYAGEGLLVDRPMVIRLRYELDGQTISKQAIYVIEDAAKDSHFANRDAFDTFEDFMNKHVLPAFGPLPTSDDQKTIYDASGNGSIARTVDVEGILTPTGHLTYAFDHYHHADEARDTDFTLISGNINATATRWGGDLGTAGESNTLRFSGSYNGDADGFFHLNGEATRTAGYYRVHCTDPWCAPGDVIYALDSRHEFVEVGVARDGRTRSCR